MKSETIDNSDMAGEALCGGGDVEGVNMSDDGVIRTVRDRKGSVSDGVDLGYVFDSVNFEEGACKTGGTEGSQSLN
jgi:hypothetical protein